MTEEQKSVDAIRYMVIGSPDDLAPTDGAAIVGFFSSEGAAKDEAHRLAGEYPGSEYAVFQFLGAARYQPRVEWKGASR